LAAAADYTSQPVESWHAAACTCSHLAATAPAQVRRWDVESGAATDTLNASKAVYCVAAPPRDAGGAGLVACCACGTRARRRARPWCAGLELSGTCEGVIASAARMVAPAQLLWACGPRAAPGLCAHDPYIAPYHMAPYST